MADAINIPDETEIRAFFRHAELVSASMACSFNKLGAGDESRSWTLKQVQGDEYLRGYEV